jgi:hypothetical protein
VNAGRTGDAPGAAPEFHPPGPGKGTVMPSSAARP